MAPLALVANMATRWCHLQKLQIWSPDGATCISLHHLHCLIALNCPLGIISQYWVGIFISQSHISKVYKRCWTHSLTDGHPDPKIGPQVYLGPIKSHTLNMIWKGVWPMLINLMFDHSRPRKSSILHVIALIKYLLEPIANCSPNDTWAYQCLMLTIVPMAKEKTRILLFP